MKPPNTHLSLDERRELFRLRSAKIPMRAIAHRLNRHPSTLYREIKRNWFQDEEPLYRGYFHVAAHAMAHGRRARLGKLARQPALAAYVDLCFAGVCRATPGFASTSTNQSRSRGGIVAQS